MYELEDNDGKTYYRGRRFLRPVHAPNRLATMNRCYSFQTVNGTFVGPIDSLASFIQYLIKEGCHGHEREE